MEKKCFKCNLLKDVSLFSKNKSRPDGLQSWCISCRKEYDSKRYLSLDQKEKERLINKNKSSKLRNNIFIFNFLKKHPCVDCGESDPIVLTFYHIKGIKKNSLSNLSQWGSSINTLKKEIEKCVVRCCNCHARKTSKSLKYRSKLKHFEF